MALMQTEMFAADSSDAIAAATAAIQSAEQAQLKLPPDSRAAKEIRRMRITAVLRSGDAKLAMTEMRQLIDETAGLPSPSLKALQIEVLLATGQTQEANEILRDYADGSSNETSSSIPIDLARLRYFLATDQTDAAANWIARIGKRHGLYARRLAEAIVLSKLDRLPSNASAESPSSALIETQARQLIRDGKLAEGGRLLARAADSQTNPDRAIEIAIAAAAALQKAQLFQEGSTILSSVANKYSDASNASALDLQAIVMLTSGSSPASGKANRTSTATALRNLARIKNRGISPPVVDPSPGGQKRGHRCGDHRKFIDSVADQPGISKRRNRAMENRLQLRRQTEA